MCCDDACHDHSFENGGLACTRDRHTPIAYTRESGSGSCRPPEVLARQQCREAAVQKWVARRSKIRGVEPFVAAAPHARGIDNSDEQNNSAANGGTHEGGEGKNGRGGGAD